MGKRGGLRGMGMGAVVLVGYIGMGGVLGVEGMVERRQGELDLDGDGEPDRILPPTQTTGLALPPDQITADGPSIILPTLSGALPSNSEIVFDNNTPPPTVGETTPPPQPPPTTFRSKTSTSTTTSETPTLEPTQSLPPAKSSGLPPAAIGGIAGGGLFLLLTIFSIVAFMFWNRRRKARQGESRAGVFEKEFNKVTSNDSHSDFGNSLREGQPASLGAGGYASSQKEFLPPIKSTTPLPLRAFSTPSPPPQEGKISRGIMETQERELPAAPGQGQGQKQFAMAVRTTERELPQTPPANRSQFSQPRQVPQYNPAAYAQQQQQQVQQQRGQPSQNPYNHQLQNMAPYNPPQLQQSRGYSPDQFRSNTPPKPSYSPPLAAQQPTSQPTLQPLSVPRGRNNSTSSAVSTDSWIIPQYYAQNDSPSSGLPPLQLQLPTLPEQRARSATPQQQITIQTRTPSPPRNNNAGDVSPVSPISTDGFDFFGDRNPSKSQGRPETMISQLDVDGTIGIALLPPTPALPSVPHPGSVEDANTRSPLSLKRSSDDSFYSFRGSGMPPLDPSFPLPPGITAPEPNPALQRSTSTVWKANMQAAKENAAKAIVESEQKQKKRPQMLNLSEGGGAKGNEGRLGSPSFWKGLRSPGRSPGRKGSQ